MCNIANYLNNLNETTIINIGNVIPDINYDDIMGVVNVYTFIMPKQFYSYGTSDFYIYYNIDQYSNVNVICLCEYEYIIYYKDYDISYVNFKMYLRKEKLKKLCNK